MSSSLSQLSHSLQVFGVATEDMDALTFGTPVLLRHMTFSEARKMPIKEFHLNKVLGEMELSQEEVSFFFYYYYYCYYYYLFILFYFEKCFPLLFVCPVVSDITKE